MSAALPDASGEASVVVTDRLLGEVLANRAAHRSSTTKERNFIHHLQLLLIAQRTKRHKSRAILRDSGYFVNGRQRELPLNESHGPPYWKQYSWEIVEWGFGEESTFHLRGKGVASASGTQHRDQFPTRATTS